MQPQVNMGMGQMPPGSVQLPINPLLMGGQMMFNRQMNPMQKLEFPIDLQVHFKTKIVGYVRPIQKSKCRKLDSLFSGFLEKFEIGLPPQRQKQETKQENKTRMNKEKIDKQKSIIKDNIKNWNPFENTEMTEDPYKTLIISRLSFGVNEKKLKKEFEIYGPVKFCKIVRNKSNEKHRGYAFVEFEHKSDFKTAYKHSDGRKIDGRRVCIDFERGRTVLNWRPRKFAGGIGDTRKGKSPTVSKSRSKSPGQGRKDKRRGDRSRSPQQDRQKSRRSRSRSRSRSQKKHKKKDKKNKKKSKRDRSYDDSQIQIKEEEGELVKDEEEDNEEGQIFDNENGRDKNQKDKKKQKKEKKDRDRPRDNERRDKDRDRDNDRKRSKDKKKHKRHKDNE